jgi:hypothetical protein
MWENNDIPMSSDQLFHVDTTCSPYRTFHTDMVSTWEEHMFLTRVVCGKISYFPLGTHVDLMSFMLVPPAPRIGHIIQTWGLHVFKKLSEWEEYVTSHMTPTLMRWSHFQNCIGPTLNNAYFSTYACANFK